MSEAGLSWVCFIALDHRKMGSADDSDGKLFIPAGGDNFLRKAPMSVLCELVKMTGDQILGQQYGKRLCLMPGRWRDDFLVTKPDAADSFFSLPPRSRRWSRR